MLWRHSSSDSEPSLDSASACLLSLLPKQPHIITAMQSSTSRRAHAPAINTNAFDVGAIVGAIVVCRCIVGGASVPSAGAWASFIAWSVDMLNTTTNAAFAVSGYFSMSKSFSNCVCDVDGLEGASPEPDDSRRHRRELLQC